MADLNAALIAFIGVLAGGYVNNFLADDYRRFRGSRRSLIATQPIRVLMAR